MLVLVGCGYMAIEYAKVLKAQNIKFTVVGRGEISAGIFTEKTGESVVTGGVDAAIESGVFSNATSAIISVGVEELFNTSVKLLENGVKHLLIEKPGLLESAQINPLLNTARKANARVYIGYNRRFFSAVRRTKEIIKEDGGVSSFTFDFTEWGHEIVTLNKAPGVKENWVLANSSHVIDLAFFIGGVPKEIQTTRSGRLNWHPTASAFAGSGVTNNNAVFSYHANWEAPGRWGLEFCTSKHKLILRPMEKLHIIRKGSVKIEEVIINSEDERLDIDFKPGLFRQVQAFFLNDTEALCTLDEFAVNLKYFCAIAGYDFSSIC